MYVLFIVVLLVGAKVDEGSTVGSSSTEPLKPSNVFGMHLNKRISTTSKQDKAGVNRPTKTCKWIKGRGFLKDNPDDSNKIDMDLEANVVKDDHRSSTAPEELMVDISNILDRVDLKDMTCYQPSSMIGYSYSIVLYISYKLFHFFDIVC